MNGKNKCKILKQIRAQIAQDNEIPYITSECKFQGDCTGTCPKCEAELRYLEQELDKRQRAGKAVAVAGMALALTLGSAGCGVDQGVTSGEVAIVDPDYTNPPEETDTGEELLVGEIALPESEETEPSETEELLGDVAYVE